MEHPMQHVRLWKPDTVIRLLLGQLQLVLELLPPSREHHTIEKSLFIEKSLLLNNVQHSTCTE